MKKTYINPQLEVIKIQTQQMLADSLIQSKGNYGSGDDITLGSREFEWLDE